MINLTKNNIFVGAHVYGKSPGSKIFFKCKILEINKETEEIKYICLIKWNGKICTEQTIHTNQFSDFFKNDRTNWFIDSHLKFICHTH